MNMKTLFILLQCVLGYQLPLFWWITKPTDSSTVEDWVMQRGQVWESTYGPDKSAPKSIPDSTSQNLLWPAWLQHQVYFHIHSHVHVYMHLFTNLTLYIYIYEDSLQSNVHLMYTYLTSPSLEFSFYYPVFDPVLVLCFCVFVFIDFA